MTNSDRLENVDVRLQMVRDYYEKFRRPMKSDYESLVLPVLESIELLRDEIRDLRSHE